MRDFYFSEMNVDMLRKICLALPATIEDINPEYSLENSFTLLLC